MPVTLISKLRSGVADRRVFKQRTPLEDLLEQKNRLEVARASGSSVPTTKAPSVIN